MIEVENLRKAYGPHLALEDISFKIAKGEVVGFLGPNGAGKTTTMRILTGYMPATSGRATIAGFDVQTESLKVRQKIGYLPENAPLYPDMDVLTYLRYVAKMRDLTPRTSRERIKEVAEICGLDKVLGRDIGELSKGYKQRVGLAQSMIHDPDVLILDEPTSGLDPNQIVEIRNLIRRLGSAKTVILSTHILSEVQATCDRVIIINEGSIVADGTPDELKQSFRGSESISVELKAETPNAMQDLFPKLKTLQHVETVDYRGSDGPVHKFIIHTLKGTDIREELFRRAVSERWVILELSRQSTSLEEIFHKLTRSDTIN